MLQLLTGEPQHIWDSCLVTECGGLWSSVPCVCCAPQLGMLEDGVWSHPKSLPAFRRCPPAAVEAVEANKPNLLLWRETSGRLCMVCRSDNLSTCRAWLITCILVCQANTVTYLPLNGTAGVWTMCCGTVQLQCPGLTVCSKAMTTLHFCLPTGECTSTDQPFDWQQPTLQL